MEKHESHECSDHDGAAHTLSRRQVLVMLGALGVSVSEVAHAQDAFKVNPRSYKVMFENEKMRVLEYVSGPSLPVCGIGKHSHPQHLTMQLTDAKVKVTGADGKSFVVEAKAGDMFWSPAETHSTENMSGSTVRAYIIELKDKDWKPSTG
jgi:quercetin dioxygenase-like cupin family protein